MTRKPLLALFFAAAFILPLAACNNDEAASPTGEAVEGPALEETSTPPPPDRALETAVEDEPPADAPADDDAGNASGEEGEGSAPAVDNRG